jgi:hypothetical protein
MSVKEKLTAALNSMLIEATELETWIPETKRESSGDYEHWAPKDLFAHSAEWTEWPVRLLIDTDKAMSDGDEELGDMNLVFFDRHRDTKWDDVIEMFKDGLKALIKEVDRHSDDSLTVADPHDPGPVWLGIAYYGIVHSLKHIAHVLVRAGSPEAAVRLQRAMTPPLLSIDSSAAWWKGMVKLYLARVLSLAGNREEAISQYKLACADNPGVVQYATKEPDLDPIRDSI